MSELLGDLRVIYLIVLLLIYTQGLLIILGHRGDFEGSPFLATRHWHKKIFFTVKACRQKYTKILFIVEAGGGTILAKSTPSFHK